MIKKILPAVFCSKTNNIKKKKKNNNNKSKRVTNNNNEFFLLNKLFFFNLYLKLILYLFFDNEKIRSFNYKIISFLIYCHILLVLTHFLMRRVLFQISTYRYPFINYLNLSKSLFSIHYYPN